MDPLTLAEVAGMSGGVLRGNPEVLVSRISKDTRTLRPGDLYLALRGENFDGNRYASEAAARGAAAAILEIVPDGLPAGFPVILVNDSLEALRRLAAAWRERLALKVLCITGSSGKTSTKEFAAAILAVRHRTTKTEGNLNNHIGLPLSILSASRTDEAAVWEIGMNHAGEIAPLASLARPDLGIVTNIGEAHIEFLGSREAIAAEKGRLAEALGAGGVLILPAGEEFAPFLSSRTAARTVLAGVSSGAVRASRLTLEADGCRFELEAGPAKVPAFLPVAGEHMVRNAVLAVAAGLEFGLSLEECADGLAVSRLTGGRLTRKVLREVNFLDDTYNANPDSMEAALATLGALPGEGRRIAVLGRMGELGAHAETGYARVGRAVAAHAGALIAVGTETTPLTETARASGVAEVYETGDVFEAAAVLRRLAKAGDIVLVKGSRSARMERVIENF